MSQASTGPTTQPQRRISPMALKLYRVFNASRRFVSRPMAPVFVTVKMTTAMLKTSCMLTFEGPFAHTFSPGCLTALREDNLNGRD